MFCDLSEHETVNGAVFVRPMQLLIKYTIGSSFRWVQEACIYVNNRFSPTHICICMAKLNIYLFVNRSRSRSGRMIANKVHRITLPLLCFGTDVQVWAMHSVNAVWGVNLAIKIDNLENMVYSLFDIESSLGSVRHSCIFRFNSIANEIESRIFYLSTSLAEPSRLFGSVAMFKFRTTFPHISCKRSWTILTTTTYGPARQWSMTQYCSEPFDFHSQRTFHLDSRRQFIFMSVHASLSLILIPHSKSWTKQLKCHQSCFRWLVLKIHREKWTSFDFDIATHCKIHVELFPLRWNHAKLIRLSVDERKGWIQVILTLTWAH